MPRSSALVLPHLIDSEWQSKGKALKRCTHRSAQPCMPRSLSLTCPTANGSVDASVNTSWCTEEARNASLASLPEHGVNLPKPYPICPTAYGSVDASMNMSRCTEEPTLERQCGQLAQTCHEPTQPTLPARRRTAAWTRA